MKRYDEYKQTGTPWIGKIPSHWEVKKLSYYADVITDFVASGSFADLRNNVEYKDEPDFAMLVRTADLSKKGSVSRVYISKESYVFLQNSNLFGGEIVLPNIGSVGDVYLVPNDLYEHMSLAPNSIMVKTRFNKFVYYYFLSKPGNECLLNISQGTTQSKFNKTQLRGLKIILPPLAEQEAIAAYLDKKCGSIDTVIATHERRIALLEELKQSVITEAITHGINPDAKLRPSGIDWIGNIPEHWQKCRIKFIIDNHADGIWGDEEKGNEEDINCYRVADFDYDKMEIKKIIPTIRNISKEQLVGKLVYNGDLLLEKSGGGEISPVGRVVIANISEPAVCSNFIHFLHIKSTTTSKFLCYYFNFLYSNKINLLFFNQTTGIQNLNIHDYLGQSIYLPPLYEQQEIVEYIESKIKPIYASIAKAKREIELLKELKQSIITEAVTGKIKVC